MRLQISKSKNAASLYVIKTVYSKGKEQTKIVEKLGTEEELRNKLDGKDPYEWAKEYVKTLNKAEKEQMRTVLVPFEQSKIITKNEQRSFNGGYLFLQQIYHELGLHKICNEISKKHKSKFDLDNILSRLIYSRILFPSSKLATCKLSEKYIEQPKFDLHQIYRSLDVIAKEDELIQSTLYKNSLKVSNRNTKVLYYDCTNFFFEIEEESGLKQYGISKEHRPNPIIQMGLFMDGDGIPLAFSINNGNTNEQQTLKPLEKQILNDFNLSKFIVCTDAGLSSEENRKFNNFGERAFITTQSIKKLRKHDKEWALDSKGWHLTGDIKTYDLSEIDEKKHKDAVFYKETWLNDNGLEQKLIVTYSLKYKNYQQKIRSSQIERAIKAIEKSPAKIKKANQTDYKRLIETTNLTINGEIAEKTTRNIDEALIIKEEQYDGFYAVCTNLENDVSEIIKINSNRWEIEECFRIMKSEFKARPVYLILDDRIKAHFTTCFISLIIYRLLEKKLENKYTCSEIINGLKDMNFYEIKGEGYVPTYTRTDFTDDLHEKFNFRTDYQIVNNQNIKNIFKITKR